MIPNCKIRQTPAGRTKNREQRTKKERITICSLFAQRAPGSLFWFPSGANKEQRTKNKERADHNLFSIRPEGTRFFVLVAYAANNRVGFGEVFRQRKSTPIIGHIRPANVESANPQPRSPPAKE